MRQIYGECRVLIATFADPGLRPCALNGHLPCGRRAKRCARRAEGPVQIRTMGHRATARIRTMGRRATNVVAQSHAPDPREADDTCRRWVARRFLKPRDEGFPTRRALSPLLIWQLVEGWQGDTGKAGWFWMELGGFRRPQEYEVQGRTPLMLVPQRRPARAHATWFGEPRARIVRARRGAELDAGAEPRRCIVGWAALREWCRGGYRHQRRPVQRSRPVRLHRAAVSRAAAGGGL